jgi:hypothetical protein
VLLYTYYISMMPYWWVPIAEYVPFYFLLAWEVYEAKRSANVRVPAPAREVPPPTPPLRVSGEIV